MTVPVAGQPGRGMTASIRRQPARITGGRKEGGYRNAFEVVCCVQSCVWPTSKIVVSVEPSSVVQGTTVAVTFRLDSTLRKIALATGEVTTVGARGQFTATDMSGFGRYGKAHDFPGRLSAVMRPPEVDRKCGIV